jgi:hypothetical protein
LKNIAAIPRGNTTKKYKQYTMARKIVKQFGGWYVTTTGVWHKRMDYQIDFGRMGEPDWHEHIQGKTWGEYPNFKQAWDFALKRQKRLDKKHN